MKRSLLRVALFLVCAATAEAADVPSPEQVLGFAVGADRKLADWHQILTYFELLDERSDRVLVQDLGGSTLENPFIVAIIAAPAVLEDLERYQEIQQTLADPRRLEGSVEAWIAAGKTVVLITCAIHGTEVASAQMSMELAYELATGEDEETREILENTITLLVPSLNPDGVNIVSHWYGQTLGTPAEGTSPPELYHVYTGHDNNRDWYMFTQQETRLTVEKIHNVWRPQIVLDVHQMGRYGARLFVPPYLDPIDPNVDPLLQAGIVELGASLFAALTGRGKAGVVTNAIYDAYTPARAYSHYHGGVRILAEAASALIATPLEIRPHELESGRNYDVRARSWNYPMPWMGGEWRLRDIVEYQKIALRAALTHAARYRESWLRRFHQVGLNAIRRTEPYAFVLPEAQEDPQSLYDLLNVLDFGMVEIHRTEDPLSLAASKLVSLPFGVESRTEFPAGSYVIRMQQPYSAFAKTLLEIQEYPEILEHPSGRLARPYDVTAHTLGIQLGVEVHQVDEPFEASLARVEGVTVPRAEIRGEGNYWLFSHRNNAFARLLNRLLREGHAGYWAPNGFRTDDGEAFPVGTLMVRTRGMPAKALLEDLPVVIDRVDRQPDLAWRRIRLPRVGLYRSYQPTPDEGWTRWILEQYEFPYDSVYNEDIRSGRLESYDVIIIPNQEPEAIRRGLESPYPPEYQGGLGEQGIRELKNFVTSGGVLVLLGAAAGLWAEDGDIPVRNVTAGLAPEQFFIPGSLLRVKINNRHPVGYGMPEEGAVLFDNDPVFEISSGLSLVHYPSEKILLSGWINGESHLAQRTTLAELKLGKGRLLLMGFRPQFRAQARATYKFLFNSLYYSTTID